MYRVLLQTVLILSLATGAGCSKDEADKASDDKPADDKWRGSGTEKPDDDKASNDNKKPSAETPAGETLPAASWQPDATAGIAYFSVEGVGLVGLENGEFFVAVENRHLAKDLSLGGDGKVYASLIGGGTYRIDGRKAEKLSAKYYDVVNANKAGEVYAADMRGVYQFDGKAWTTTDRKAWGDKGSVKDLAFDVAGNAYLVSVYNVRVKKPGSNKWELADTQSLATEKPFFSTAASSPDGSVYFSYNRGIIRWQDGSGKNLTLGGTTSYSSQGSVLLPTGWLASGASRKLSLYGPGGKSIEADKDMLGFDPKNIRAVAGDGQKRIWMATDVGVALVDDGGKLIQHWKPGTVSGITGRVSKLVVTKGGPELPKLGPVRKGNVTGKIGWDDGKPAAGKPIEMCENPKMMFRKSPCEDAAFHLSVTTGADGSFRFEEVPVGPYGFAIKAGDKWSKTLGSRTCCSKLTEGGTFDIGSLKLRRKPPGKK